jgi:CBS domain-containing protein
MRVRDVMTTAVITIQPDTPFRSIWELIFRKRINAIPVVSSKEELVGIVTKEDILKTLYPDYGEFIKDLSMMGDPDDMAIDIQEVFQRHAEEVMKTSVVFTREDTLLMRALARMMAHRVNQLPVLSDNNRVVGMITKSDIFYSLYGMGKKLAKAPVSKKSPK